MSYIYTQTPRTLEQEIADSLDEFQFIAREILANLIPIMDGQWPWIDMSERVSLAFKMAEEFTDKMNESSVALTAQITERYNNK